MYNRLFTILTVLFLFLSNVGSAQTLCTAKTIDYVGTITCDSLVARDWIRFSGNVIFPTGDFKAKIDEALIVKSEYLSSQPPTERILDKTLQVGSLPGSFDVNSIGSATYTIPIDLPPGTTGMKPNISLFYNSMNGNGIMGMGWSLSGLSSISRVGQDRFNEGDIQSVNYSNDRLSFNGQRLILSSGTWFSVNSEYRTQHESFRRIKYNGTRFEVESADGMIVYFGESDQAKLKKSDTEVLVWYISRIVDQNGNTINYYYKNLANSKEVLIDRIEYTKTNSFNAYNKIQFVYENERPDFMKYYNSGIKIEADHILKKIIIFANGQRVRDYSFNYFLNSNRDSYLSSIELTGESGLKINSTQFNWNDKPEKLFIDKEQVIFEDPANLTGYSVDQKKLRIMKSPLLYYHQVLDCDGDGISDILNIPTHFNASQNVILNYNRLSSNVAVSMPLGFKCAFPIDIDGDGKQEVFFHKGVGNQSIGFSLNSKYNYDGADSIAGNDLQFKIYKFQNDNLIEIPTTNNYGITGLNNQKYGIIPGDYDGNGLMDLLFYSKDIVKLSHQLYLAEVDSEGAFNFVKRAEKIEPFFSLSDIYVADINGDRKQDVIRCNDEGIYFSTFAKISGQSNYALGSWITIQSLTSNPGSLSFGDYNGDNKADFIIPSLHSIYYGTGIMSLPSSRESFYLDFVFGPDYNGDGNNELFNINFISDATSYITSNIRYITGDPLTSTRTLLPYSKQLTNLYGDFNGDGMIENLFYFAGITKTPNNNFDHIVHKVILNSLNHDRRQKILGSIIDGVNHETTIEYENTTSDIVFEKNEISNLTSPIRTINPALMVVKKVKTTNGINGQDSIQYFYKNARIHIDGRGFLGFGEVVIENPINGLKTTSIYTFENTYFEPLPTSSILTLISSGKRISGNYSAFKTHSYNTNGQKHYLVYPDTTSNWDYLKMQKQKTTYNYTANDLLHGSYSTANVFYYNVGSSLQINASANLSNTFESFNNGKYYRLKTHIITKQRPGMADYKIKKSYDFISSISNRISKEIVYYFTPSGTEDSDKDTISFSYDSLGNVIQTQYQLGNDKRYASQAFDQYGRFAITTTNSLGHSFSSGFDDRGYLIYSSDANGIKTTNYYNGLGQITAIDNPDGSDQTIVTAWVSDTDADKPLHACYYSLINTNASPYLKTYYDILGRPLRAVTEALNGKLIFSDVVYNNKGQQVQQSDPYFKGETIFWNYITYDAEGRISSQYRTGNIKKANFTYDKNKLIQTVVNTGEVYTKTIDAAGLMIQATDPEGTVSYNYYASGSLKQIVAPQSTINIEYNKYGTQSKLLDPDAGNFDYEYNAYGDLNYQKDSKNDWFRITRRDKLGRPLTKTTSDGNIINFSYDGQLKGMVDNITNNNGTASAFLYDELGRMKSQEETIEGQEYLTSYDYDERSNIIKTTYHTGTSIDYIYNAKGYLTGINQNRNGTSPQVLWNSGDVNAMGQWKNFSIGGTLNRSYTYNSLGMVSSIVTGTVQNLQYSFNEETGNLTFRKDVLKNLQEDFTYSNNKLTSWKVGSNMWSVAYKGDGTGRVDSKTDAGTYVYGATGIHKVTGINNNPGTYNSFPASITYTAFNKIDSIYETGGYKLKYTYGSDEQRKVSRLYNSSNAKTKETIYLSNGCEIEKSASNTRTLHYISLGGSCWALIVDNSNTTDSTYFILTDHLGSAHVITNTSGIKLKEYSFDPWGRRRNPTNWTYNSVPSVSITSRGFTMHEHMDQFNLINMNGRAYDPVMGQFLSADPFIQDPGSTIYYNRYSYCMNNPLNRTDPSGYIGEDLIDDATGKPIWLVRLLLACDGRGGTLYSIIQDLRHSAFGGTWNAYTGTTYFSSDEEALGYGMDYVDYYGDWQYTEHKSALGTISEFLQTKYKKILSTSVESIGSEYLLAGFEGGFPQIEKSSIINTKSGGTIELVINNLGYQYMKLDNNATYDFFNYLEAYKKGQDAALLLMPIPKGKLSKIVNFGLKAFGLADLFLLDDDLNDYYGRNGKGEGIILETHIAINAMGESVTYTIRLKSTGEIIGHRTIMGFGF